ncbi:MAG: hypothetical protein JRF33_16560 [Deltaproteobacteria bacterium]|nr:hypothetical protein [Deltaproteobacteria bacterium]
MRRWKFWVLALAFVAVSAILLPACGSNEPCEEYSQMCGGRQVWICLNGEWETSYECSENTFCCQMDGYVICAVNCM